MISSMDQWSACGHGDHTERKPKIKSDPTRQIAHESKTEIHKRRKRLLNSVSENPLLRPLTSKITEGVSKATSTSIISTSKKVRPVDCFDLFHSSQSDRRPHVGDLVEHPFQEDNTKRINRKTVGDETCLVESDHLSDFIASDTDTHLEVYVVEDFQPLPRSFPQLVREQKPSIDISQNLYRLEAQFDSPRTPAEDSVSENDTTSVGKSQRDKVFDNLGQTRQDAKENDKRRLRNTYRRFPRTNHYDRSIATSSGHDPDSEQEDPLAIMRFSPPRRSPTKPTNRRRAGSPQPDTRLTQSVLTSPKKLHRIPQTPHRPSTDAFWQPEIINDWNDEYSPVKAMNAAKSPERQKFRPLFDSRKALVDANRASREAKNVFRQKKHLLADSFFLELDKTITQDQISKLTEVTGGVKLIWSKKLSTTAGRANWKRETVRTKPQGPDDMLEEPSYRHYASIELAEKVIDDEDRLLNVIAHEFCHLANFMVSGIKTNPHGKEFKAWAAKCSQHFGNRGVEVTTKHSYTIDYKYTWECTNCGSEFKRHSKSIDPVKQLCGSCKSTLVQTKPVPRGGEGKVNDYQVFVKQHMKLLKQENPRSPQKELMSLVAKRYQEAKASKQPSGKIPLGPNSNNSNTASAAVDMVARKLDLLDLTSHGEVGEGGQCR